ncbi:extracellular solute-binding protein [Clostridium sp. NSJ-6]|uniref:Extracellular solute-binding protein n=1 Tax=Clostridium hominis TaxID=2763036 RepID=A0ABR7D8X3_9CLOT|nr:extracellular solute-binding protein [Clostridium hominis]MBC5627839.1 extracellular solute-binding protein [Clostridium hominis]
MLKTKKVLAAIIAATMVATVFTGCGSSSTGDSGTGTGTETGNDTKVEKVTLNTVSMFGGTDPNAEVYQEINKEFMAANENITIEDNSQSSDEEWKAKVATDFASGNEPDVIQFFTDATANAIVATDKLMAVEDIKKEYPDYAKDTLPAALDAVTNTDGIQRAIPTTGYWEGLFCNKDLFDQYNIELPTDWASLETAIKTFKENGIIPFAVSLNNVPHYFVEYLMLYSAGEESYTSVPEIAPAEWTKGLETFKTLRDMGAFPEDTDTVDEAYVIELFNNKQAAMILDGSWRTGGVTDQENTVVISFPGVENQKAQEGAMVGGISSGFYITKKAWEDPAKREAAVKFVEAHTGKEGVTKYWIAGGSVGQAAVAVEPVDGMSALAVNALEYSSSAKSISAPTDSRIDPEAYKYIIANVVKISTGAVSAEDVLNEALKLSAERAN